MHVHVPWWFLTANYQEAVERIGENGVGVELYLSAKELDSTPASQLNDLLLPMVRGGTPFTIHAPFMDLSPGSADPWIRKVSIDRWLQLVPLIELVAPRVVVVHPGYNSCFYQEQLEEWQKRTAEALNVFIDSFTFHTRVAVENIFDREPGPLRGLLERANHPGIGCCFDVGHFNVFGKKPLGEWFDALGRWVFELHIHDNDGGNDDHLALGKGNAPLRQAIRWSCTLNPPPVLTIEAHTVDDLLASLLYLDTLK